MNDPTDDHRVARLSRSFLGHPRGLVTLFMTEFFERFTYYGMRAMLVLFLVAATTGANPGFGVDASHGGRGLRPVHRRGLPGLRARRLDRRPPASVSATRVFWGGVIIAVGNFILAIPARRRCSICGLAVIVRRRRAAEAQHLDHGRRAVRGPAGRATRRGLLDLLHGHQPRRVRLAAHRRHHRRSLELARRLLLLRPRHVRWRGAVPVHAAHGSGNAGHAPDGVDSGAQRRRWTHRVDAAASVIAAIVAWMFFAGSPVPIRNSAQCVRHRDVRARGVLLRLRAVVRRPRRRRRASASASSRSSSCAR